MALVDVFEDDGEVSGAEGCESVEEVAFVFGDELAGLLVEDEFLGEGEVGVGVWLVWGSLWHGDYVF